MSSISKCEYCKNVFSNKQNLKSHQHKAKYCLKIQGKKIDTDKTFICEGCKNEFIVKHNYNRHLEICQKYIYNNTYKKICTDYENKIINIETKSKSEIKALTERLEDAKETIRDRDDTIKHLQEKLSGIAEKAASRPFSVQNTKNIQINNIIQNLEPLDLDDMGKYVDQLTLSHHKLGAEGYAKFALEGPLKNKLCCTDMVRESYTIKDKHGNIIIDIRLQKVFTAFCNAFKMKSYLLAQDHYQELAKKFTEAEMDNCETMNYALSLARYRFQKDNKFCKEITDYIKNNCNTSMINKYSRKTIKLDK